MGFQTIKSVNTKFARTLIAALAGWVIAGGIFLILTAAIRQSGAETKKHAEAVAELEERRRAARDSGRVLSDRGGEVDRIDRYLVDRERPIAFLEQVEGVADMSRTRVTLDLVEGGNAPPNILVFRVTADGSEKNTVRFLKLLEQLPYQIRVEEFTFQRLSAGLLQAVAAERGVSTPSQTPSTRLILLIRVKAG